MDEQKKLCGCDEIRFPPCFWREKRKQEHCGVENGQEFVFSRNFNFGLLASALGSQTTSALADSGCQWYVVQSGETLADIAAMYGLTYYDLMIANNISNPDYVQAGQQLCIPERGKKQHLNPKKSSLNHNRWQPRCGMQTQLQATLKPRPGGLEKRCIRRRVFCRCFTGGAMAAPYAFAEPSLVGEFVIVAGMVTYYAVYTSATATGMDVAAVEALAAAEQAKYQSLVQAAEPLALPKPPSWDTSHVNPDRLSLYAIVFYTMALSNARCDYNDGSQDGRGKRVKLEWDLPFKIKWYHGTASKLIWDPDQDNPTFSTIYADGAKLSISTSPLTWGMVAGQNAWQQLMNLIQSYSGGTRPMTCSLQVLI
jgi:hypothetical protein